MNKTQKGAWFSLVNLVLLIAYSIYCIKIVTDIFSGEGKVNYIKFVLLSVLIIFGFMVLSAIFLYKKKQSPAEVDSDERDNLIKKRAVLVSFISLWFSLAVVSTFPWLIVGIDGTIPVCILPIINLAVFFPVMLVYCVTILILYGRGGKDGKD